MSKIPPRALRRRVAVFCLLAVVLPCSGGLLCAGDGDLKFTEVYQLQLKDGYTGGYGYGLGFSPDGKTGVLGTNNPRTGMVVFDAATGQEILRLASDGANELNLFVDYSPDGRFGAAGCLNGEVRIWSLPDGQKVHYLVHGGVPSAVEFSPDARRLASVGTDGTLRIWDVASGAELSRMQANTIPLAGVSWSPDGRQVATSSWDRTARIWDIATESVVRSIPHPASLWCVDYSPDGRNIATVTGGILEGVATEEVYAVSDDNKVRIWDVATGELVKELEGLRHASRDLAYSPDGKLLAVASVDKALHVWDVASGEEVGRIDCETWMNAVAWTPDGKSIAVAGGITRGAEPTNTNAAERLRLFRVEKADGAND